MSKNVRVTLGDPIVYFDVDDTLIVTDIGHEDSVPVKFGGMTNYKRPHRPHIEELKKLKKEGWSIVVWTHNSGGVDWAVAVCEALGIDELVDAFMWKPSRYYDDLPAHEFMTHSHYLDIDDGNTKKHGSSDEDHA